MKPTIDNQNIPTVKAWLPALKNIEGVPLTMPQLINSYGLFPLQFLQSNEPNTPAQKELIGRLRNLNQYTSQWLKFYLL